MSTEAIHPSSLDGIKRLAKSLSTEHGIQHVRALDDAARAAGFQNFRHASNVLRQSAAPTRTRPAHRVYITVYWKDRKTGTTGRETLSLWLSVPWGELVTPAQLQHHRALMHFRGEGTDHLARVNLEDSQSQARRQACATARTLQFMDATKLRPSKSHSRAFPGGRSVNAVPGRDHYSIWYDRDSKRFLFADEPYELAAQSKAKERAAWSAHHGFPIVKPDWPGMYNPDGGSRLYLTADAQKGVPLAPVVAALNALSPPIMESTWDGESAPFGPIFFSPGAPLRNDTPRPKRDGARKPSGARNSVQYMQTFVGPQRRPKGRMPIKVHAEVGNLLKSVLAVSYHRKGVYNRVGAIRCELDEWTQREYNHDELPNEQFFDLYYHGAESTFARSITVEERDRHVASLTRVQEILVEHYPECPPLRSLTTKLSAAVSSLQGWAA